MGKLGTDPFMVVQQVMDSTRIGLREGNFSGGRDDTAHSALRKEEGRPYLEAARFDLRRTTNKPETNATLKTTNKL